MLSSLKRSEGFVLFIVLVIVALISSLLFSVYYLSQSSYKRAEEFKDYNVAYHAGVSAVKIALELLKEDSNSFDGEGDNWAKPFVYNYRGIFVSLRITDECGKLNVNKVTDERWLNLLRRLLEGLGVEPSLADAIKDWVDSDDEPEPSGAEAPSYTGYAPSNAPMKTLGELYYVRGVTEELYKKLSRYLTVYGKRINVNSATKELLLALSPHITPEVADSIIEARPIKEVSALLELPGVTKELYFEIRPLITTKCDYFKVAVTASYGEATAQIEAYTSRSRVLEWKVVQ